MSQLFTTIERQDSEEALDFNKRIAAEVTGKSFQDAWTASEVVVTEGYESPYLFGRKLRGMVGDDNATVFRFHTVDGQPRYVAFGPTGAAVYDPTQRAQKPTQPTQIDYYEAADGLSR